MDNTVLLETVDDFVLRYGNTCIYYRDYTDARQIYDIATSVEMALSKQNLLDRFQLIFNQIRDTV